MAFVRSPGSHQAVSSYLETSSTPCWRRGMERSGLARRRDLLVGRMERLVNIQNLRGQWYRRYLRIMKALCGLARPGIRAVTSAQPAAERSSVTELGALAE